MTLTPRLALAARLCAGGRRLIDVGCDHGYLSIALVGAGGFESALACDLRPGPLGRAAENIRAAGLEARIATRLADGLWGLRAADGNTIAICGMGGELIAAILAAAPWALKGGHRLVLQPQSKGEALRAFLAGQGCVVEEEALAAEGDRLYSVLAARGGGASYGSEVGFLFTPQMTGDPLFPRYLARLIERQRRAIEGRQRGGLDCDEAMALLHRLEGMMPSGGIIREERQTSENWAAETPWRR